MADAWVAASSRRRDFARRIYTRDRADPNYLCPKCHQPIDWTLPYKDPTTDRINLYSKSVDHITEIQDGGAVFDLDNAWTTHLTCNSSKGAARRWARHREQTTSRTVSVDVTTL